MLLTDQHDIICGSFCVCRLYIKIPVFQATNRKICTTEHCQDLMYSMFSSQHIIVPKQRMHVLSGSGYLAFLWSTLLSFPAALKALLVFMHRMMPVFSPLIWLQHSHFKFKYSQTQRKKVSECKSRCRNT